MALKEIQKNVDDWTSKFNPQYWPPLEMLAALTEENGEVAREMNTPRSKLTGYQLM